MSQFIKIASFMGRLKKEGVIRFWGFSATTPDEVSPFLRFTNRFDIIEMTYTIIYQEPTISIFKELKSSDVGIIAKEVSHRGRTHWFTVRPIILNKPIFAQVAT